MIEVRKYGLGSSSKKREVIVLHGGPAAAGSAAPIAKKLELDGFKVLEPHQRSTEGLVEGESLTVNRHIVDLHEVIISQCVKKPIIVGESWGAMLALAYAAEYPQIVGPIILVGCGTFSTQTRALLNDTIKQRIEAAPGLQERLARLDEEVEDTMARMRERYRLTERFYHYAKLEEDEMERSLRADVDDVKVDMRAHQQTWNDMLRLQTEGVYPEAFKAITSEVMMIHGEYDPHPGIETYELLKQYIPQLDYRELERCGHCPWLERYARTEFFSTIRGWLAGRK